MERESRKMEKRGESFTLRREEKDVVERRKSER